MTTLGDPLPGGRPGDVERAGALSGELADRGVHGIVLAYLGDPLQDRVDADELGLPDALRPARWAGADHARRVYRLPYGLKV